VHSISIRLQIGWFACALGFSRTSPKNRSRLPLWLFTSTNPPRTTGTEEYLNCHEIHKLVNLEICRVLESVAVESFLRIPNAFQVSLVRVVAKKPSCVKAVRDVVESISSLERNSYLRRIIGEALDVLNENMLAGKSIEKRKFPRIYVQKYNVTSLYKYNLDASNRLIYTLVADESGTAVVVLEIMNHKGYEKRFGYR
jgi:hypothetical protein